MRIFLDLVPSQTPVHRARLTYAFRLYCAIYGHEPVTVSAEARSADVWISYSEATGNQKFPRSINLANALRPRDPREPAPPPRAYAIDDEATILVHWPPNGANPDWLGEIFEWVSCADEYSITKRDSVGRVPFKSTYSGRHQLDISLPYAAIAMRLLNREISKIMPGAATQSVSPFRWGEHFIVNTHDVDFLPLDRMGSLLRLAANSAISLLSLKSPKVAAKQLWKLLLFLAGGRNPFNQVTQLAECESQRSLTASYFFIPRKKHRKDANYSLGKPDVNEIVQLVELLGMEVGLHGSFTSLDAENGLASELDYLRENGFCAAGGRQHWLRFTLDRLIASMEKTNMLYDTSLGWSDRVGFRAGACFAFPPYNFEREAAATFLEIPLVAMDQGLLEGPQKPFEEAARLLATSRQYGWGGISLLWHPAAFDGVQLPEEIGNTFWKLVDNRSRWNDVWLSGADFVSQVRQRYESVGLPLSTATTECSAIVQ